jgi:hypothetical protein
MAYYPKLRWVFKGYPYPRTMDDMEDMDLFRFEIGKLFRNRTCFPRETLKDLIEFIEAHIDSGTNPEEMRVALNSFSGSRRYISGNWKLLDFVATYNVWVAEKIDSMEMLRRLRKYERRI